MNDQKQTAVDNMDIPCRCFAGLTFDIESRRKYICNVCGAKWSGDDLRRLADSVYSRPCAYTRLNAELEQPPVITKLKRCIEAMLEAEKALRPLHPDKADELKGAAGIAEEWVEHISGETE